LLEDLDVVDGLAYFTRNFIVFISERLDGLGDDAGERNGSASSRSKG
jgi:hypothetical protein